MSPRTHPNDEPALRLCQDPCPVSDSMTLYCALPDGHEGDHQETVSWLDEEIR